ncbi:NAD kinase [Chryseobacterium sp. MFBS3-17]|uniref:NAD kinase n=1 Tax=Chryseobacterium sp. MFBS3-17 TaxID=2886689 RepID=UPI001D0E3BB0|nr:NAD kinase [Chryseobacterium sp. MFBS3-17]MCC2591193.1 NAD kinase [Chryseobacterium sp. MFBS3-17]
MKAAIYSQKTDLDTFLYLSRFISELAGRNIESVLHETTAQNLQFSRDFQTFASRDDLKNHEVDFFFSFGGDGTILNALIYIQDLQIPVIGVNTGRLGFLASFSKEDIFKNIDCIMAGDLILSKRSVIEVFTEKNNISFPYALNDLSIVRKETTAMVTVDTYINDDFLTVFWADGLIVSTPTGSTAYSLSCGGPIIAPTNDNFVLTPIAPHNLNVRPIVLKDDVEIRLKVESRVPSYSLSLDSRLYELDIDEEVRVKKAPFELHLLLPKDITFYDKLRERLLWGKDKRN